MEVGNFPLPMRSLLWPALTNQRTKSRGFSPPFLVRREIEAPQRSVIRGHRRGDATLFSFVLEDAAPPTLATWSIMNSSQKSQRGCSGRRLLVFKNISPTASPLLSRARLIVG